MFSKALVASLLCSVLASCGNDDGGDGGSHHNPYGDRRIDTSTFKNEASEGQFKTKGQEVDNYFKDMGDVKSVFMASGAGNSVIARLMQVNDGGLSDLDDCQQVVTTEDDLWAGQLTVVTTTCEQPIEGGNETCVTTTKTNANGDLVSETSLCRSSSSSQSSSNSDISIGDNNQYVPSFQDVQDCDDAFNTFEESYAGLKQEFDSIYGMLMQPDGLNLSGAGLTGVGELKKVENDDKGAVTYEFAAPASSGISMSGSISGGANESTLLLRQDVKVALDMTQMMPASGESFPEPKMPNEYEMEPGIKIAVTSKGTIAVDMEQRLIEQDVDMAMSMGEVENEMVMTAKGRIALSAGEEKFVIVKMDLSNGTGDQIIASHLDMETRLVDAKTLSFTANMKGLGEGSESSVMTFTVKRNEDGICQVVNQTDTF